MQLNFIPSHGLCMYKPQSVEGQFGKNTIWFLQLSMQKFANLCMSAPFHKKKKKKQGEEHLCSASANCVPELFYLNYSWCKIVDHRTTERLLFMTFVHLPFSLHFQSLNLSLLHTCFLRELCVMLLRRT